jgi:hypothetical protein
MDNPTGLESVGLGNVKPNLYFTQEELDDLGYSAFMPGVFASSKRMAKSEDPTFSGLITFEALSKNIDAVK